MKSRIRKIMMISIGLVLLSSGLSACNMQPVKITASNTAMGTVVQTSLYATEEEAGGKVIGELQEELERLEQECLSWRMEGSWVARINGLAGDAEGVPLSEELNGYLEEVWKVSQKSDGALDITVGKVTGLWDLDTWATLEKEKQQEFTVPNQLELEEVLQDTGYEKIILEEGKIRLPKGMCLDMGAVGKGIACDRIGKILKGQETVKAAVVSVGGSVVTYGTKPDGSDWNVAITHPREEGTYLGTISLQGEWYVSTSGDYERFVDKDGKRYHHIMDPDTGYPVDNELCSVTIVSDNGLLSDALSTACFVLGAEEGRKLAESLGAEALFVTKETELIMTDGMRKKFEESK